MKMGDVRMQRTVDAGDRFVIRSGSALTADQIKKLQVMLRNVHGAEVRAVAVDVSCTRLLVWRPGEPGFSVVADAANLPPESKLPHVLNISSAKFNLPPGSRVVLEVMKKHAISASAMKTLTAALDRWAGPGREVIVRLPDTPVLRN